MRLPPLTRNPPESGNGRLVFAMRDATGYRCPGRAGRYHVKVDEHGERMGWFDDKNICDPGYGYAACDRRIALVETTEVEPAGLAAVLICRRSGCRAHVENYLNGIEGYP